MKKATLLSEFKSLYEGENYEEAISLLKANKSSFEEGVFYFNMGSVFFAKKDYAHAKRSFLKAKQYGQDSEATRQFINQSNQNLNLSNDIDMSFSDYFFCWTNELGSDFLASMLMILSFVLIVLSFKIKELWVKSLIAILAISPALYFHFGHDKIFERYIALDDYNVSPGPSAMFSETFLLPAGVEFIVSKKYQGWSYIIYPSKYTGWLKLTNQEKI